MMRMKSFGFVAVTTLMIGLLALPVISTAQNAGQETSLDELLKQRRDTLRQLVEVVTEQYLLGESSFDSVVRAKDRLIEAELELANNRQERLALLRQQVEMFKNLSATTDKRFQLGQVSQTQRLAVRVAVLDAKIRLAREQDGNSTIAE